MNIIQYDLLGTISIVESRVRGGTRASKSRRDMNTILYNVRIDRA
jgi:hypothetical protein